MEGFMATVQSSLSDLVIMVLLYRIFRSYVVMDFLKGTKVLSCHGCKYVKPKCTWGEIMNKILIICQHEAIREQLACLRLVLMNDLLNKHLQTSKVKEVTIIYRKTITSIPFRIIYKRFGLYLLECLKWRPRLVLRCVRFIKTIKK